MPTHSRSRFERLPSDLARIGLALVVTVGLLGLVLGATVLFRKDLIHTPSDEAETADTSGDFVVVTEQPKDVSSSLDFERSEGDLDELTVAELTALCWAHNRYRDHSSVSADILIMDDPGLLRAAELLDGDFEGDEVALRAEAVGSNLGTWREDLVVEELRRDPSIDEDGLGRAVEYLMARSQPPSDHAEERFVVFEVARTLSVVFLVRMRVGSVVNDELSHRRNTAIYAHVESPDRDEALRVRRPEIEQACDAVAR